MSLKRNWIFIALLSGEVIKKVQNLKDSLDNDNYAISLIMLNKIGLGNY